MAALICDRIEGDTVILIDENETVRRFPLSAFPSPPKEGDVFDASLHYDASATAKRRAHVHSLFQKLKKKGSIS